MCATAVMNMRVLSPRIVTFADVIDEINALTDKGMYACWRLRGQLGWISTSVWRVDRKPNLERARPVCSETFDFQYSHE